jgi:2,3-bisphosphoglycerate-dependent phosphoglycerate mutase
MQILLIRHGQSEADILNVHEGRADFPLTELGRRQVKSMAERVSTNYPPELIWSSTLQRASETAKILSETVNCPIKFDDKLMEYNNGVLAGLSFEEGKKYSILKSMHERIEGGESAIEFRMRVEGIFSEILQTSLCSRIAIVCHGGVINNILRAFFRLPVTKDYAFMSGDTAIHYFEVTEDYRKIHFLNSLEHLSQIEE